VKIYPIRRKATKYRFFQIAWYELGVRRTKTLADPLKAKAYAQQVHVSLLNLGRAVEVTPQDVQMLRDAETIAAKFGVSLPFAIREWADTKEMLRGTPMLAQAKGLADALRDVSAINAQTAAKEYIRIKERARHSKRHTETVRALLDTFGRKFPDQMLHELTVKDLQRFIDGIKGAPRTKNNFMSCLKTFFIWAQKQSYVRQDRQTAANALNKEREAYLSPEIFTPEEMRKILTHCEPAMIPYMTIGAFAGLRSAEIARLDWSAIDFDSGYIKVSGEITKTQQRRLVPILPSLRAWLFPHKKASGSVTFFTFRKGIHRCTKAAGIAWKANALRHSFGSYRLAEVQDAAKVSLEMGNSPAMLFKHYRELVTPEQAKQWFEIMPL
jgi:integrase